MAVGRPRFTLDFFSPCLPFALSVSPSRAPQSIASCLPTPLRTYAHIYMYLYIRTLQSAGGCFFLSHSFPCSTLLIFRSDTRRANAGCSSLSSRTIIVYTTSADPSNPLYAHGDYRISCDNTQIHYVKAQGILFWIKPYNIQRIYIFFSDKY